MKVTLHRFGRNRRLVLMLEWLTFWPTLGPLAVSSQLRYISSKSSSTPGTSEKRVKRAARGFKITSIQGAAYRGRAAGRQGFGDEGSFPIGRKMPSILRFARILPQISLRNLRKLDCEAKPVPPSGQARGHVFAEYAQVKAGFIGVRPPKTI